MATTNDPREIEPEPADDAAREHATTPDDGSSEGHSMSIIQGGPDPRTMTRDRQREIERETSGRRILSRIRDRDR